MVTGAFGGERVGWGRVRGVGWFEGWWAEGVFACFGRSVGVLFGCLRVFGGERVGWLRV